MQRPTDASPQQQEKPGHVFKILAAVLVFSLGVFGYGVAVAAGLLPEAWGIVGAFQYIVLVIGSLLVTLTAVVSVWFWYHDPPPTLTTRRALFLSLVAAVLALGVAIATYQLRVETFFLPQFLGWTFLGLLVLSVQFPLATVDGRRKRRRLVGVESTVLFCVVFGFLLVTRGDPNLVSYVFVSGSAVVLLLTFGVPLYLLGSQMRNTGSPN
jgi:hypothetical protein